MIAILALQGAFAEHQQMLSRIGITSALIRNLDDWRQYVLRSADYAECGLIIPGGESTTMMRIMHDEGLTAPISEAIKSGMPVFGTCAGLILLDKQHLDTMSITAKRNAYGRQLGSFRTEAEVKGMGFVPMTFIRAPYIETVDDDCEALAIVDNRIVAARQGYQLVTAFHPELDDDTSIHRFFISMAEEYTRSLSQR